MGYEVAKLNISTWHQNNNPIIYLKESAKKLKEIIITAESAAEIVTKAHAAIDKELSNG
ncbi:MAG: hypothetical protein ACK57K_03685 [Chryseotalea sp.]